MANVAKPARKKFRVAVSGATVDGREIRPEHLRDAAANYSPDVYGARVNVEHYISPFPGSDFGAMGDVTALSAEDISEGPLAGRTALYAEIEPSERMKKLTEEGKKIYSSIELHPQFALNGKAYVVGLAMTDTPASLGTERLKFAAQQRAQVMKFSNQQGEAPLFTDAIEAELIELAEQRSDEGKQWFSRVMGIIGKGRKSDSEQFSQVREAVENVAQSHADLLDRFSALEKQHGDDTKKIEKLTGELATLTEKLKTLDNNPGSRFAATGGNGVQMVDF
ncbi:GPO family capsid scaffolding protein [Yersinia enterocolitica]|uniref:GPO family capsid scaffolding protein n=1 Tax=Yersinia enterocolitica TaxID=630 RepID=UPI001C8E1170|nr:GPO family capsid scaffolding protein [Yersinia enterocolitica]MBX9477376.1 GPO family capsid scaffolding protein [Yersinia enterocolitica]